MHNEKFFRCKISKKDPSVYSPFLTVFNEKKTNFAHNF